MTWFRGLKGAFPTPRRVQGRSQGGGRLRYVYADDLHQVPTLRDTMFRDRADQFRTRLGWDVDVSDTGEERDAYDALNPLYAMWEGPDGRHAGSMRFLPTTGATMLNDHFLPLLDGAPLRSPRIWESTRFCLARGAAPQVSGALMLAAVEVGLGFDVDFLVGVFDARMVRIYRRLGWEPAVLNSTGTGRDCISVGLWHCTEATAVSLAAKLGIPRAQSRLWFHQAMAGRRPGKTPFHVVACRLWPAGTPPRPWPPPLCPPILSPATPRSPCRRTRTRRWRMCPRTSPPPGSI